MTRSDDFQSKLESHYSSFKVCFESGSEAEADKLIPEFDEFKNFVEDIQRLETGKIDPVYLSPIEPGKPNSLNIYVLRHGKWMGCYWLDFQARVGKGMLVIHGRHKLKEVLKILTQIIKNQFHTI